MLYDITLTIAHLPPSTDWLSVSVTSNNVTISANEAATSLQYRLLEIVEAHQRIKVWFFFVLFYLIFTILLVSISLEQE